MIITLIITSLCCFCAAQSYDIVLATNFNGNVVKGSKQELVQLIREGKPVRVGWQLDFDKDQKSDFDHWVEATFITILGEDVFTQIDPIFAQGPDEKAPQVEIYASSTRWTAILGTNGKLLNRFVLDDSKKPNPIFDDSLGVTIEEFESNKKEAGENWKAMNAVQTWEVATFWSVQK